MDGLERELLGNIYDRCGHWYPGRDSGPEADPEAQQQALDHLEFQRLIASSMAYPGGYYACGGMLARFYFPTREGSQLLIRLRGWDKPKRCQVCEDDTMYHQMGGVFLCTQCDNTMCM